MSMSDIMSKDKGDKSLEAYKDSLLGKDAKAKPKYPDNPAKCVLENVHIRVEGSDKPIVIDPKDKKAKEKPYNIKEGSKFVVVVRFYIQHDIVSGLKFQSFVSRLGVQVDKDSAMMGSYAPKTEIYEFNMPEDTAPSGMMSRGHYTAKGKLLDDDKNLWSEFEYSFDITK